MQGGDRQQLVGRQRRRERRHARLGAGLQDVHQALRDIDRHRLVRRRPRFRLAPRHRRRPDEIPGLRPGLDQPAFLELAHGLHHGGHRQPAFLRQSTHRRQTVTMLEDTVADHAG
jgi:hypothetical protein